MKHAAQVAGAFQPANNITNSLKNFRYITKLGIQAPEGSFIYLKQGMNETEFEIGTTGILEFEDVNITSVKVANYKKDKSAYTQVIMDCVYEDGE